MKQRKPNRLKGYDYSKDNLYFVTSCVHDMICCFGDIVVGIGCDLSDKDNPIATGRKLSDNVDDDDNRDGTGRDLSLPEARMILNEHGKIADRQWYWLAEQYPYVVLHEFIIMPNHIHGIIEINTAVTGRDLTNDDGWVGTGRDLSNNNDRREGTDRDLSVPKIKSVSELMGAYKMTVSKKIHESGDAAFEWQRSFHDHIIRNQESYEKILNYIINNPNSWDQVKFFKM